jgi:hypothetical protein
VIKKGKKIDGLYVFIVSLEFIIVKVKVSDNTSNNINNEIGLLDIFCISLNRRYYESKKR